MNINNPLKKVWNNPDLQAIINSYLQCIWCNRVPYNVYPNIKDWDLLTNGKCIHCLRKEYDAYF